MELRYLKHAITGLESEFCTVPYLQVVFVGTETTAEQRVGQSFEVVGAKAELKSEEFSIMESAHVGPLMEGKCNIPLT